MRKKIISVMLICAGFPVGSLYAVHPAPVTRIQSVQQNGACTGVVKDASGEAVIGASVTVDGTTNGTITDLDGNFSLSNVPKGSTIKISFVGYNFHSMALAVVFWFAILTGWGLRHETDEELAADGIVIENK